MKRTAYHHGNLKQALSDAAVELLAEVGPDFTLRQVAQRVGVTHGAAYRHFEDREALLAELARRGFVDLRTRLQRATREAPNARGKLEAFLKAYLRFAWERPAQYEVMFGRRLNESGEYPELEEAVLLAMRFLQSTVSDYLEDEDPVVAQDRSIGLWSFAHGFSVSVLRRRIHVESLRAAQAYIVLVARPFLDGMRRKTG
jgi:AcrR family transcriptional regulator